MHVFENFEQFMVEFYKHAAHHYYDHNLSDREIDPICVEMKTIAEYMESWLSSTISYRYLTGTMRVKGTTCYTVVHPSRIFPVWISKFKDHGHTDLKLPVLAQTNQKEDEETIFFTTLALLSSVIISRTFPKDIVQIYTVLMYYGLSYLSVIECNPDKLLKGFKSLPINDGSGYQFKFEQIHMESFSRAIRYAKSTWPCTNEDFVIPQPVMSKFGDQNRHMIYINDSENYMHAGKGEPRPVKLALTHLAKVDRLDLLDATVSIDIRKNSIESDIFGTMEYEAKESDEIEDTHMDTEDEESEGSEAVEINESEAYDSDYEAYEDNILQNHKNLTINSNFGTGVEREADLDFDDVANDGGYEDSFTGVELFAEYKGSAAARENDAKACNKLCQNKINHKNRQTKPYYNIRANIYDTNVGENDLVAPKRAQVLPSEEQIGEVTIRTANQFIHPEILVPSLECTKRKRERSSEYLELDPRKKFSADCKKARRVEGIIVIADNTQGNVDDNNV